MKNLQVGEEFTYNNEIYTAIEIEEVQVYAVKNMYIEEISIEELE